MPMPNDVLYASNQIRDWLGELKAAAMLTTHNECHAMLRAVLHEFRGHMAPDQAVAFGDILPPLVRGIFYEGWRPLEPPAPPPAAAAFHEAIVRRLASHHMPPDTIAGDVFRLVAARTDPRVLQRALDALPAGLVRLWREAGA